MLLGLAADRRAGENGLSWQLPEGSLLSGVQQQWQRGDGAPPAGRVPSGRRAPAPHNPRGDEPHSQCPASCGTSAAGARAAAWGWGRPLLLELLQHHGSVHRGCHGTAVRYKLGKYLRRGGLRRWVPGVDAAPRPWGSWCLKKCSPTGSPLEPSCFAGFPSSIPRLHEPDIYTRILAELTARVRAHKRARCTALAAQSCQQEGARCPEPPRPPTSSQEEQEPLWDGGVLPKWEWVFQAGFASSLCLQPGACGWHQRGSALRSCLPLSLPFCTF